MKEDTIIAISTPLGYGGLGIVRLSGNRAFTILKKIFIPKSKNKNIPNRTPVLGNIYDFNQKECFEKAYSTFFPCPHSYTGEDMVEISSHGSPVIMEEILRLGIMAGARLAQPGEFTQRAFLNGKLDIIQAEAINTIIHSTSIKQAKLSFHQMEGSLSKKLMELRQDLVQLLSQIEADIEFPEEDLKISQKSIIKTLEKLSGQIGSLKASYNIGKILREGLSLAIAGKSNVGKSTLFNTLLGKDRAIVSSHPGTTRDYLREQIQIKDINISLIDTAGIIKTSHPIEKEGIKRGKKIIENVDGVLIVLDSSQKADFEDFSFLDKFSNKKKIIIFNKSDLPKAMDTEKIRNKTFGSPSIELSALKKINIDKLKYLIYTNFIPEFPESEEIVFHLRQKLILEEIEQALLEGQHLLRSGYSAEIYVEEIRKTLPLIGQLTGEIHTEEILENIFSRFCVGK
ncbi:MAG: tRNA uridine-5-carboxymethylaminomethyl(34) synthesis GTPase MnmE [Candidatus Aminicenantes bacterium]|nr:tRNA uridine-5-carboxymethylaminomethyl(34) synthesis GTPase MnmE [Candidatus Aminicenantes bacterium]